ncbi:hypothetical protein [Metallosphaera sp.]|uniref:hypothetical protein n=1 Tax=Metallosphaera sp. TaxID=2020860 RepID=UPI0031765E5A
MKIEKIKEFWDNGGRMEISKKCFIEYNKSSYTLVFHFKDKYIYRKQKSIFRKINEILDFKNKRSKKYFLSAYPCSLIGNYYTMYVDVRRENNGRYDFKRVYMIDGILKICLRDYERIKENSDELRNVYNKLLNKVRKSYLHNKYGYDLSQIVNYGGLEIHHESCVLYASVTSSHGKYVLTLPENPLLKVIVKSKGYDLAGSVIFKVLIVNQNLSLIHQLFLIGKEYTGQWWLHNLPPTYWNKSISQCERWLLELKKDDIIVSES